jgi:hypothetical protein
MTDNRNPGVLGSLPRTRPHRRSDKRPAVAASAAVPEPVVSPVDVTPEPTPDVAKTRGTATAKPRATGTAKRRATATASAKPRTSASAKPRAAAAPKATAKQADAKPAGETKSRKTPARQSPPPPAPVPGAVETAVQAAAELAEIGLQASARALRRTLSRLPRP